MSTSFEIHLMSVDAETGKAVVTVIQPQISQCLNEEKQKFDWGHKSVSPKH